MSFFESIINKRVDKRVNDILNSGEHFEIRDLTDEEAGKEISSFIVKRREEGTNQVSTLDIVLSLKIPAEQVDRILEKFLSEKGLKEISYAR